jgi:hypothetical protein
VFSTNSQQMPNPNEPKASSSGRSIAKTDLDTTAGDAAHGLADRHDISSITRPHQ